MNPRNPDISRARVYDDVAETYERVNAPLLFDEPARRLVAAAALDPGARVLDVGSGTGAVSRAVLEALGGDARVTALDPAVPMLLAARRAGIASLVSGALPRLPFQSESFDGVLSAFVLSHVEEPQTALDEMIRVLRPGGVLAVSAWAPATDEFARMWTSVVQSYVDPETLEEVARLVLPGDENLSREDGVRELLTFAGLESVSSIHPEIESEMTAEEYIEAREVCATGRALRVLLSSETWRRFRAEVRGRFQTMSVPSVRLTRTIHIAAGRKAALPA